jgi:hypothetical protein
MKAFTFIALCVVLGASSVAGRKLIVILCVFGVRLSPRGGVLCAAAGLAAVTTVFYCYRAMCCCSRALVRPRSHMRGVCARNITVGAYCGCDGWVVCVRRRALCAPLSVVILAAECGRVLAVPALRATQPWRTWH